MKPLPPWLSQLAEAAFMQMYKMLSEAPDPLHELQLAAELTGRVAEADAAVRKLAKELEVANKDAAQVRGGRKGEGGGGLRGALGAVLRTSPIHAETP